MERRATWARVCHSWEEVEAADREYWVQYSGNEKVAMIPDLQERWATMSSNAGTPRRSDIADLPEALNRHGVRYLIVGAHAVAFHAQPRYTEDLDILVEATRENGQAIVNALNDFGFGELNFSPEDFAAKGRVVQLGYKPNRIEFLTSIAGVEFGAAWEECAHGVMEGHPVCYLSKPDLIRAKQAAARPKDLIDLDLLRNS